MKNETINNANLEIFKNLASEGVTEHTKAKDNLNYLPWAKAWDLFKRKCPDATYKIHKNERNTPYFADETGIMVYTSVTVNDLTYEMWLPVMNAKNKAMRLTAYDIEGRRKNKQSGQYEPYTERVEAATMMDINKAIMRCLTKNLAMFGLGLHVYEGEDITMDEAENMRAEQLEAQMNVLLGYINNTATAEQLSQLWYGNEFYQKEETFATAMYARLKKLIDSAESVKDLENVYKASAWAHANADVVDWCVARKVVLKQDA